MDTEDDDELNRIYQDIEPSLTDKDERDFYPWHKPRKHYLRIHQWCAEVQKLIQHNNYQEGEVIRYLGFPGEDFLDIRVLRGVCEKAKVKLRYLGFDRSEWKRQPSTKPDAAAQLTGHSKREFLFNLAKHEVFNLGFIQMPSYVLKDDFCVLANVNSIAYRETSNFRDFDIINIDLCDSLASPSEVEYAPYFEAIKQLCDLQVTGRTTPWILFLTTRAIRDQLDRETKQKLFNCVLENVTSHGDFASELAKTLSLDYGKISGEIAETEKLDHGPLVSLFGLSIGKWLLKMMMEATPKLKVKLLKSYSYRVEIDEPDMLSLAFSFEPHVNKPVDRSGLTKAASTDNTNPDERQLAIELLQAFGGIQDIDEILHNDDALHTKMTDKCADMLASVHYDEDSYKKWVQEDRWCPSK
jgi:hypothetical protein